MSHLGSGYPLYYQFLKQCIILLFFIYVINGAYFNYLNYSATKTKQCYPNCPKGIHYQLSFTNRDLEEPDYEFGIALIVIVLLIKSLIPMYTYR